MGSAEVVPPPPSDFIRLYHLVSARHGLENIERGRLKVSRFQDLNDPFELLAVNFKEKPIRAMVRDFKASYHTQTGLLCFSANWTNPVLWSNYSDKHRGICLGFDLPRNRVQQVEYADERILPELADDARPLELSEAQKDVLLRTKFRHWQYESEHRVFVPLEDAVADGALHFCPFCPDLQLKEVILGPQFTSSSLNGMRKFVSARYPNAVTFGARLAFKFFAVVPDERTVPVAA
jgi:hypothetical protein